VVSLKASVAEALDCQSVADRPVEGPELCGAIPDVVPPAVLPTPAVPAVETDMGLRVVVPAVEPDPLDPLDPLDPSPPPQAVIKPKSAPQAITFKMPIISSAL